MKTDLIQDLKGQRRFYLKSIEHLESEIEKFETNSGGYNVNDRIIQIDFCERRLEYYRNEFFRIHSELAELDN